jgi:hypothetical protein
MRGACTGAPDSRCCVSDFGFASCVDTTSDIAHCGACGHRCGAGERCTSGVCSVGIEVCPSACGDGEVCCRGACCARVLCDRGVCGADAGAADAGAVDSGAVGDASSVFESVGIERRSRAWT